MPEITFRLPSTGVLGPRVIRNCEWRVRTFVERDAYAAYDHAGCYAEAIDDVLRERHIAVTNSAMRARMPRAAWAPFLDTPLPELSEIPPDLDLITAEDSEIDGPLAALTCLAARITKTPGLKEMAVSKVLFLLRPKFVVIADSYVRDALGVRRTTDGAVNLKLVMEAGRAWGRENASSLERLMEYAESLNPVTPTLGPCKNKTIPLRLSRVRILDILLWTEIALYGPTKHQQWSQWYKTEVSAESRLTGIARSLGCAQSDDPWVVFDYEVSMFRALAEALDRQDSFNGRWELQNACVESLLLHIRILSDLLLGPGQLDDITLDDLLPSAGLQGLAALRCSYGDARDANSVRWTLNKMLAHPTRARSGSFDYSDVLRRIIPPLEAVIDEVNLSRRAEQ